MPCVVQRFDIFTKIMRGAAVIGSPRRTLTAAAAAREPTAHEPTDTCGAGQGRPCIHPGQRFPESRNDVLTQLWLRADRSNA